MIVLECLLVAMETPLSCGRMSSKVWGNAEPAILQSHESQQPRRKKQTL